MKNLVIFLQLTAIAAVICCGIFLYFNGNISVELVNPSLTLPLWLLKTGSFASGIIAGAALCGIYLIKQFDKISALQKRNEKKEITSDDNEAKIKVLENKIATLEKALNKALGG